MARKIAGASALLAFAVCLFQGIAADNTIATTLSRALYAMGVTFGVGLVIGAMARKMDDEHEIIRRKQEVERLAAQPAVEPPRVQKPGDKRGG